MAIDNADDLVEEYSGYGLRFEARRLGTRRLGASLEWSRFDQDWRSETLDALALSPAIPRSYDTRSAFTPLLKFAFSADLSVAAGVSISELEPRFPATGSQMANAAVDLSAKTGDGRGRRSVAPSEPLRRARRLRDLESDLSYRRFWDRLIHSTLTPPRHATEWLSVNDEALRFERFTLGESTRSGRDKYDIAPAGGDRNVLLVDRVSLHRARLFLDVGSVWTRPTERRSRLERLGSTQAELWLSGFR